jgi:hypothetical protein
VQQRALRAVLRLQEQQAVAERAGDNDPGEQGGVRGVADQPLDERRGRDRHQGECDHESHRPQHAAYIGPQPADNRTVR